MSGLAIANLQLKGVYGGAISRLAVQGGEAGKDILDLDDIEAVKKKDSLSADDISDITNTLLYLGAQQPLDGENKKIFDALVAMLMAKPAVLDKVERNLKEQTSTDTGDGVNEATAAGFVLDAFAAAKGPSIVGTGSGTTGPENTIVNPKYWEYLTQTHPDDKAKARLSDILNLPATTDIEKKAKLKALVDYLRNTLGWTQGFIAVALSSKYLLRGGIEKLNVDTFESFVRNEIVAFYNTSVAPSLKTSEKKSPLYLYDEFTIVDASDPEMAEVKDYLQSDAAREKAKAAGIDYSYDDTKSFAENFIAYTSKMGMSFVEDTKQEFLKYDAEGKTTAEKATVKTLSAKKFLESVKGKATVGSTGGAEDPAAKRKADLAAADALDKVKAVDATLIDKLKTITDPQQLDDLGLTAYAKKAREAKTSAELVALGLDAMAAVKQREEAAAVAGEKKAQLAAADTLDKLKAIDATLPDTLKTITDPQQLDDLGLTAYAKKAREAKTSAELAALGLDAMAAAKERAEAAARPQGITIIDDSAVTIQSFQSEYATIKASGDPVKLAAFLDNVSKSDLPQAEKDKYLGKNGKAYVFQNVTYRHMQSFDAQIFVQDGKIYLVLGKVETFKAGTTPWYYTFDPAKGIFTQCQAGLVNADNSLSFLGKPAASGYDAIYNAGKKIYQSTLRK